MKPQGLETSLDSLEFLAGLDAGERARLAAELETVPMKRGDVLMRQGEAADALYIVVSGRFAVTIAGRSTPISEIGPGQPIGEIAFLAGGTRTATVSALRDGLVLRLGKAEFDALSARSPALWRTITVALARRVAELNKAQAPPPDPRPRTIAVIRAGAEPVPAAFVERMMATFRAHARVRLVTAPVARRALRTDPSFEGVRATEALNALESRNDYVVFLAEAELDAWSDKAIRQADLVLAVGRHGSDAIPSQLERRAAELLPPTARRLVLLHERRGPISGTARWLSKRDVAMHHHVALDTPADMERLYRFISGTAIGLIACGGGALCTAQVGLYQALTEAGLSFDIMGGTSAGSAFTAAFALGRPGEEIDAAIHEMFVTNKAMRRYTWPLYSLLDHRHFDRELQRLYGSTMIEDLWLPYFAVSTNLSRYELERHQRGPLWAAVRASGSIPVLLPPYYTAEGDMLVDGCLLDNVPIHAMHEVKSGPNVVMTFEVPNLERFPVAYDELPSRGQLVREAVDIIRRRASPKAPHVGTVLLRSLMANRKDFTRHLSADDLLLVPPLPPEMGFLDWHRHGELSSATRAWATAELARLRREGHPLLSP
jgi:NTE family protein